MFVEIVVLIKRVNTLFKNFPQIPSKSKLASRNWKIGAHCIKKIWCLLLKTTEETSWVKDKYPEKGYKENEGQSFFSNGGSLGKDLS